jgi:hypothetical protein
MNRLTPTTRASAAELTFILFELKKAKTFTSTSGVQERDLSLQSRDFLYSQREERKALFICLCFIISRLNCPNTPSHIEQKPDSRREPTGAIPIHGQPVGPPTRVESSSDDTQSLPTTRQVST